MKNKNGGRGCARRARYPFGTLQGSSEGLVDSVT